MEPVKFEDHLKEQLQKREIRPAAGSWDKLEARLEQQEKPKGAQFWWIGAAAAIAGVFFFLGTLFNASDVPAVVEQTPEVVRPQETIKVPQVEVLVASEEAEEKEVFVAKIVPKKNPDRKTEHSPTERKNSVQLALIEPAIIPESQVEKVVAEVKPGATPVSDLEVDALLYAAMAELEQERAAYAVQPVNADELLQEVEYELDQNFRQKVFEVLKEGFSKAKTAVANRNQ